MSRLPPRLTRHSDRSGFMLNERSFSDAHSSPPRRARQPPSSSFRNTLRHPARAAARARRRPSMRSPSRDSAGNTAPQEAARSVKRSTRSGDQRVPAGSTSIATAHMTRIGARYASGGTGSGPIRRGVESRYLLRQRRQIGMGLGEAHHVVGRVDHRLVRTTCVAASQVGGDEALVDARGLAVGHCRQSLTPSSALHVVPVVVRHRLVPDRQGFSDDRCRTEHALVCRAGCLR